MEELVIAVKHIAITGIIILILVKSSNHSVIKKEDSDESDI